MLGKAADALLELAKMPAAKGEEADDEHVSTIRIHISRAVEAAMISVSILLPEHPELLNRFLLRAACILHNAQGGADFPPPPPPESRVCFTQDECGLALNALLDLVPLTIKIEKEIEQEDYLLSKQTGTQRPPRASTLYLTQDETLPLRIKIEEDMEEPGFLLQQEDIQRHQASTASDLQKALTGLTMALKLDPGLTNNSAW